MSQRFLALWIAFGAFTINQAVSQEFGHSNEIKSDDSEQTKKQSLQPMQLADPDLPAALKDIIQLRQLLSPHLGDTNVFDENVEPAGRVSNNQGTKSTEIEFREALRKISGSEPSLLPMIQSWRADEPPGDPVVAALQEASDQLDRRSRELEAENRFERAKDIRKLAKRIRKEMRLLAESASLRDSRVLPR